MSFNGFPEDSIKFFRSLGRNNNRDWFQKHKGRYDESILAPAKEFVTAISGKMTAISPDINTEPRINAAIRRINRDIRFSPDKTPYKTYQDFRFLQGRGKEGPGYFVRFAPDSFILAAGAYRFDKGQLERYREAVADDIAGKALEVIIRKVAKAGYEIGGSHYKRVPGSYGADHPRGELLKHAGLYAYVTTAIPKEFFGGALPAYCTGRFKKMAPLNDWVVEYVG